MKIIKQLGLAALLSIFALPAFAAIGVSMEGLIDFVIYLIIIGIVFGILFFLVNRAPFIPPEWKQIIIYVIYFVAALFVINMLLGLAGHPIVNLR